MNSLKSFLLLSALILTGCASGTQSSPMSVAGPSPVSPAPTPPPAPSPTPAPPTPDPTPTPAPTPPPVSTPTPAPPTPVQTLYAWGNSQTQGFGLTPCPVGQENICHPPTAWPAVFAAAKGWTVDNQANGGTTCADLTLQGTSESLWDLKIDSTSKNIYGHFHNEEILFGTTNITDARNCIEAQTAWLAIPESQKVRAINCTQFGKWTAWPNSASALSQVPGSTLTCVVTGKVVYFATARVNVANTAYYSVSIDGQQTGNFDQLNPSGDGIIANFIRIPAAADTKHTIVYTCVSTGDSGCLVFYAAGVGSQNLPEVYSLSPVPNASWNVTGNFDPATFELYYKSWYALVAELQGDGLNIVPIDVTKSQVYEPNTQSQPDGVHETVSGHDSIGSYAATLH